jgi:hypothetical protein
VNTPSITTAVAVFATLLATGCASTSVDAHLATAHSDCTMPGTYVVNPDTRLHGFATNDPAQPRVVTPGTAQLEGRGVTPSARGVAVRSPADTERGRGDTRYCF